MNTRTFKGIAVLFFSMCTSTQAMNLLHPYDNLIRPDFRLDDTRFHLDFYAEHGFNAKGFNNCGLPSSIFQLWNCNQNALAMLNGFDANSAIGQLAIDLRADGAVDDGIRGHFNVCGDLDFNCLSFDMRYHFCRNWFATAYIPYYTMRLRNVVWQDLTQDLTAGDASIKAKLTDNFCNNVSTLGNLNIGGWKRNGIGDVALLLEWIEDFRQMKPFLKNVRVNWRVGLNIPTGVQQNEDLALAFPFGYNGAVGIIYGLGLDLSLGNHVKVGADLQLTQLFGNTRCRRIKTDPCQTEPLLLQKALAYEDFGLVQRLNIYAQIYGWKGFGIKVGYQFFKIGDEFLSLKCQDFSDVIANSAESLQDKVLQSVFVIFNYDISKHLSEDACIKPSFNIFSRIPVRGKRFVASPTIGGVFAIDF